MRRKPLPAKPDPRPEWMVQQGNRCGCKGTDDMCPCQNEDQSQPQSRRDLAGEVRTLELQQQTDRQTIAGLLRARETAESRATAAEALLREAGEVVERVVTLFYQPGENIMERFERVAAEFYDETHILAPGKSEPLDYCHEGRDEMRRERYERWVSDRVEAARALATLAQGGEA